MNDLRQLMICEAKRIIELLQDDKTFESCTWMSNAPELTNKMKEFRRDSIRLEKELYNRE